MRPKSWDCPVKDGGLMSDLPSLEELEDRLGYRFNNVPLLKEALTHKSFANENRTLNLKDNERLEFLGDAVLDLIISDLLYGQYPEMPEGELSKKRAAIVREETLCGIARGLGLGYLILLGKGEEMSGGRRKNSLLANALEATIAAVYLDGGMERVYEIVRKIFMPLVSAPAVITDFKSELQEICQKEKKGVPKYSLVSERGPDHDKTFEVVLEIGGEIASNGVGKNIKEAEQMAASRALKEVYGIG